MQVYLDLGSERNIAQLLEDWNKQMIERLNCLAVLEALSYSSSPFIMQRIVPWAGVQCEQAVSSQYRFDVSFVSEAQRNDVVHVVCLKYFP